MHLSKLIPFLLASLSILAVALPAPLPIDDLDESSVSQRSVSESGLFGEDVVERALAGAALSSAAAAKLQQQHARKDAKSADRKQRAPAARLRSKDDKKDADKRKTAWKKDVKKQKTAARKAGQPGPKVKRPKLTPQQASLREKRLNPKKAARREAYNKKMEPKNVQARKKVRDQRKTQRKQGKLAKGPATTPKKQRPARMSADDRTAVNGHLSAAATKMKTMAGVPQRKGTFSGKGVSTTGRAVRQAIMNQQIHDQHPVGDMPKHFNNGLNKHSPGRPLPKGPYGPGTQTKEYPVTGSGPGWHGDASTKGGIRVITDTSNGRNTFHGVVTHAPNARPGNLDHHEMTYKAPPPPPKPKVGGRK